MAMARRRLHRPATHLPFERGPVKAYDMMSELHNSFRAPPDDVIRHHVRPTRVKTALALEGDRLFTTMSMYAHISVIKVAHYEFKLRLLN
jgi:hypothetical protein